MSIYSERLAKLKKEIKAIESARKKKRWKPNQKIIIDYINGVTKQAEFIINTQKIILKDGDSNKGFIHIIERHYCRGCPGELDAIDIINLSEVISRGIKLNDIGISNKKLNVYQLNKNGKILKVVLNPNSFGELVVTYYNV
ncbi:MULTISPECIES: hypothetical protein [Aliarcobacter]|uniref:hypothetical protein n=1 Tax=Aliarcobacter TaxID=2321111 RepID=UPI0021B5E911|nr:hypothetical protein [Aliarcobacter cryaerophilus]MCT7406540.1 hypothetical protein [Aliarcobacter cryaerophilus]MCT7504276.1 hypothetical protein [Aliarcobacter cryaerophilus]